MTKSTLYTCRPLTEVLNIQLLLSYMAASQCFQAGSCGEVELLKFQIGNVAWLLLPDALPCVSQTGELQEFWWHHNHLQSLQTMSNQSQKEKIRSENPLLMSGVRADWATPGVAQSTFLTWDKEVYPEPGCWMETCNRHTTWLCLFFNLCIFARCFDSYLHHTADSRSFSWTMMERISDRDIKFLALCFFKVTEHLMINHRKGETFKNLLLNGLYTVVEKIYQS